MARRDLMRLLVAAGQPRAALEEYEDLENALRAELDAAPSAEEPVLIRQQRLSGRASPL
jgi:DNA-binding SARP family transcriptional activator